MVNEGNVQGAYQSASGRVGFTNFPYPFLFFLEGRPHTIVWPTLCAGSHAPKILPFLGLYIAVQYILHCNQQCMPNTLLFFFFFFFFRYQALFFFSKVAGKRNREKNKETKLKLQNTVSLWRRTVCEYTTGGVFEIMASHDTSKNK